MLFHFSENPDIASFRPRQKSNRMDMQPVVWAVDPEHQYGFYCPRNCPRIVISRDETADDEFMQTYCAYTTTKMIIAVEQAWYERIRSTPIYRYTFDSDGFQLFDAIAGYYISEHEVIPQQVEHIDDPIQQLCGKQLGIELRFVPSLHPLRQSILTSGWKDFSIHRFEYAAPH